jgi:quinolinate synthase
MKKITLENILSSLKNMETKVEVPAETSSKARRAIVAMLAVC